MKNLISPTIVKLSMVTVLLSFSLVSSMALAAVKDTNTDDAITNAQMASSEQAKSQLQDVLKELNTYQANFTQTIEDWTGEILQVSEGSLLLSKPNKLRWEVTSPDNSVFIADGTTVYSIDPFVEQVTIIEQAQIVNNNPLMLLISDDPAAWSDVRVSLSDNVFTIFSNNPEANITQLTLQFDSRILKSLVSIDRQQQINRLVFSQAKQNIDISDEPFTLTYPEHYMVDDQRSSTATQ